ncbi:MAG: DUF2786 domain-containing protein [Azospirillaceae bacterium]|nr:DUF2786 domain-containing protein [Azospirillaceae bacterium]
MTPPTASNAELDKLKSRIQALRAKTVDNGCTEEEAMTAAAKVAELLDRYDLSLSDVEIREQSCERLAFETGYKKRIPLDGCVGAIADFCDCRVWREKNPTGDFRYVYFGLRSDVAVAHYLTDLIDAAVRAELGRFKTSPGYLRFKHNQRPMANSSFSLGMVASIATRLGVMKAERDAANRRGGRDLVIVKTAVVDEELAQLDLNLKRGRDSRRMVSPSAYDAGSAAGESLSINPGIGGAAPGRTLQNR